MYNTNVRLEKKPYLKAKLYFFYAFIVFTVSQPTWSNQNTGANVGVFVSSKTFDGKDQNQRAEYNKLIQNLTALSQNYSIKTFPIKDVSRDALILAKAALDGVQTVAIVRKISPNYIATSLWDVQNYELIGESAFESMGNQKLIDDFSSWFGEQNSNLFRKDKVDEEIFSLQLIDKKQCKVLSKYLNKTKLPENTRSELAKNCALKESFNRLLSGKKQDRNLKAFAPALIKVTTKPQNEQLNQQWVQIFENSLLKQNLGRYDISNLNLKVTCKSEPCKNMDINIDIVAYSHFDFRTQYRLSNFILKLIDRAKKTFPKKDFSKGAEAAFYHEYTPVNTFKISGSSNAPSIVTKNPSQ